MKRIGAIYRFMWSHTIGRPWTFAIREWAQHNPGKAMLILPVSVAGVIFLQWWLPHFYIIIPANFIFFLLGHLFWDTPGAYIQSRRSKVQTAHLSDYPEQGNGD